MVYRSDIGDLSREVSSVQVERLRVRVISIIRDWAGSKSKAEAWFESYKIPSLGNLTPRQLIERDRFGDLEKFLDHVSHGSYA